jgi:hypothetical protein
MYPSYHLHGLWTFLIESSHIGFYLSPSWTIVSARSSKTRDLIRLCLQENRSNWPILKRREVLFPSEILGICDIMNHIIFHRKSYNHWDVRLAHIARCAIVHQFPQSQRLWIKSSVKFVGTIFPLSSLKFSRFSASEDHVSLVMNQQIIQCSANQRCHIHQRINASYFIIQRQIDLKDFVGFACLWSSWLIHRIDW